MRILLINSNRYHSPWPVMPLGLCSVAAALEEAGHEVRVLDLCFSSNPAKDLEREVSDLKPHMAGIGIRNIDNCVGAESRLMLGDVRAKVVEPLRLAFAGPIVLGGCALGISGRRILDAMGLDHAIRGDGEEAAVEFARQVNEGRTPAGIPGLIRKEGGRIVEDNPPDPPADLDRLPWPRVHRRIDVAAYRRFRSPMQVQSKRGCALTCAYCTYNAVEGRAWRLRDPERIADEIEEIVRDTGIRHVEFVDSTFNIPLDHAKDVLDALLKRSLDLELRTLGLNPGALDRELVDRMARVGFREVDVGAEAGTDATLEGLGKNYGREALLEAGRLLHGHGISAHWFLILGGPGETRDTVLETFRTMDEVAAPWDMVGFNIGLRVYDGSPLAARLRAEDPGCTRDDFLEPIVYRPQGIPIPEIRELAVREVARRPNFVLYDEVERTPDVVTRVLAGAFDLLGIRAPLWKALVAGRRVGHLFRRGGSGT